MPGEDKWAQYAQPADKWAQYAQPASPTVAGAGPLGTPQPAAHPAVDMQSSALSPSLYGSRLLDDAKGLVNPLRHFRSQIASYPGFVDPSKQGGPIQTYQNNPDKGEGLANALTDTAVAAATPKLLQVGGDGTQRLGQSMQESGVGLMNKTVGALKPDFKRGANPGQAYFEAGGGPALSMSSLAEKGSGLKSEVGTKIGNAVDSSTAAIPTGNVRSVIQAPIDKGIALETGPGGMGNTEAIERYADGFKPALTGDTMTPRQIFDLKGNIAKNTNWSDPTQFNLKAIRQQQNGALSGLLSDNVPELLPLNSQYQGLSKFAARAGSRAETGSSPLTTIAGKLGGGALGAAAGYSHGPEGMLLGTGAGLLMDSVPVKTTAASGLYHGGKGLTKLGSKVSGLFDR